MQLPPFLRCRALILMFALGAGACGGGGADGVASPDAIRVPGPGGSTVTLESPADRVLPGNAGALDLVAALVDVPRIVAITEGTAPYSVAIARGLNVDAVRRVPHFDLETILSLEPDIVVTHAWQSVDKGPFLQRVGLPVFEVPESTELDGLIETLTVLGQALGADERASELAAELRARVDALGAVDRSRFTALTYSSAGAGAWTAGSGTTADAYLRWAGVTPAGAAAGLEGHSQVDHERLLDIDPQILVVAADDGTTATSPTVQVLRADARLAGLRALGPDGLIVALPDQLYSCTSHHLVDAAERIAAAIDERWPSR